MFSKDLGKIRKPFPRQETPAKMGRPAVQVARREIIHHNLKSANQLNKETSELRRKSFLVDFEIRWK